MSITLRELARMAGVSVGTASQALRGVGTTSVETRERIRNMAAAQGYRPDPLMAEAGRRHRAGSRGRLQASLGVLICRPEKERRKFPNVRFREECDRQIAASGNAPVVADLGELNQMKQTLRVWFHRGVRGIILLGVINESWFNEIDWDDFAVVFLGGNFSQLPFNSISMDYPKCLELALRQAMRMSRRIGVVLPEHEPFKIMDDALRAGVLHEFLRHFPDHFVEALQVPFPDCATAVPRWNAEQSPELVVGVPAVKGHLPESVPFIYYTADHLVPGEMGVMERPDDLARISVNMLADMIWRGESGIPSFSRSVRLAPEWMDLRGDKE